MERIRELRKSSGMSQKELAERLSVNQSAVSQWERGETRPGASAVQRLADIFGVTVDYIIGRTDNASVYHSAPLQYPPQPSRPGTKWIKVLGRVIAGIPVEAIEDIIDYEEIDEKLAANGDYFALKIKGDSMEPRLFENDVVIVREQPDAETGDIVIAMINDEDSTCKRLKKLPDGIMLIAMNPEYEPLFFSNREVRELPVRILGKVVELRRKFI